MSLRGGRGIKICKTGHLTGHAMDEEIPPDSLDDRTFCVGWVPRTWMKTWLRFRLHAGYDYTLTGALRSAGTSSTMHDFHGYHLQAEVVAR